jgi:hypothetical protein
MEPASEPTTNRKQGPSLRRLITFGVLFLLILLDMAWLAYSGARAYDRHTYRQMNDLYARLQLLLMDSATGRPLTKNDVHNQIGRVPTRTHSDRLSFTEDEEYDFPGAFYVHRVTLRFRGDWLDDLDRGSIFRLSGE